ncbi:MAG: phosphoribosylformylglycinamidine cyclo-ligase [Halobacteriota archaeon]|nr:phosphoribosylformylglycinamidine cyclo-ligase [Halobacteriota archaeon]
MSKDKLTYSKSGVDINAEEEAIKKLSDQIIFRRRGFGAPLTDIGHYAGLIDFGDVAIALTTDGVGSKVIIASEMKRWNTIGIDCIAMNVNDLIAIGVEPLAFVDYLAMEVPDEKITVQIGEGLAKGAELANISIVGGETATLPEIVNGFDLAGTAVGWVKKDEIIGGEKIKIGDKVLGLASSGIHSNGLTLARKVIERSHKYSEPCPFDPEKSLGDELLTPTKIYIEVLDLIKEFEVHGLAHITGSGLLKLKRITDYGFDFTDPLEPQDIFKFIQKEGDIDDLEMYRTFNMGMGFLVVLPESEAKRAKDLACGKIVGEIIEDGIFVGDLKIV